MLDSETGARRVGPRGQGLHALHARRGRAFPQGLLGIKDCREDFIFHLDEFQSLLSNIRIGGGNGSDLALSPDGTTLYVTLCTPGASGLQAIDLRTRAIAWTINGLRDCGPLIVSPQGDRLFMPDLTDLAIIDTGTRAIQRIHTPAARLSDLVLTPDGRTLYVAAAFAGFMVSEGVLFLWPTLGEGYLLNTLTSVFLGGTSVFGGTGSIFGTFIAAFIIAIINPGIVASGWTAYWTQLIYGGIIVVSVSLQAVLRRRMA